MKKILIVGASILQVPAIIKAKEKGYWVGVADYNPAAVGIPYADAYFNVSTIDSIGLLKVAESIKPDGIMTMATDMPIRAIAYVTSRLGLMGHSPEVAFAATDKIEMIKRFKKNHVASPWFFVAENFKEIITKINDYSLPIIIKPADSSGSRGVVLVRDEEELLNSFQYSKTFSQSGSVIVEQYIEGDEVSVELFVVGNEPIVLAVTDKATTNEPYFVEIAHSQPTKFTGDILAEIKKLAINATKAIGIMHGPVHAEMKITSSGPVMIELGARMGGDCITSHLVPLSTGIDMVGATIDCLCNEDVDLSRKEQHCSAICFLYPDEMGSIIAVQGMESLGDDLRIVDKYIEKIFPIQFTGLHSSTDRIGYLVVQANTSDEIDAIFSDAKKRIKFIFAN